MPAALLVATLPGAGPGTVLRAYDPAAWGSFFTAVVTAAAGLTGLLFVAVSINLDKILEGEGTSEGPRESGGQQKSDRGGQGEGGEKGKSEGGGLAARAAETLGTLLLVLVTGALTLIPEIRELLGLELVVLAGPMLAVTVTIQLGTRRKYPRQPLSWTTTRMLCTAVATVPATWAGISLVTHVGGGLYWLAAATLLGIVGAVFNAWVLLVEIIR